MKTLEDPDTSETITILSSREFNLDRALAKRQAMLGPVMITSRESVTHVLLSLSAYQRLTNERAKVAEVFSLWVPYQFNPMHFTDIQLAARGAFHVPA